MKKKNFPPITQEEIDAGTSFWVRYRDRDGRIWIAPPVPTEAAALEVVEYLKRAHDFEILEVVRCQ